MSKLHASCIDYMYYNNTINLPGINQCILLVLLEKKKTPEVSLLEGIYVARDFLGTTCVYLRLRLRRQKSHSELLENDLLTKVDEHKEWFIGLPIISKGKDWSGPRGGCPLSPCPRIMCGIRIESIDQYSRARVRLIRGDRRPTK